MSVFLDNIDDFIAPSQACINPFISNKNSNTDNSNAVDTASTSTSGNKKFVISLDSSKSEFETKLTEMKPDLIKSRISTSASSGSQKVATVSLNDCLACSGCVTSAETVLISQQSYTKFLEVLNNKQNIVIISISPQSSSSLADLLKLSVAETFLKLATIFKILGVTYVFDTSSAGDVALTEVKNELLERIKQKNRLGWCEPAYSSTALSSTRVNIITKKSVGQLQTEEVYCGLPTTPYLTSYDSNNHDQLHRQNSDHQYASSTSLPLFVSSCPGWICYAEKMHPQVIPYLSTVKSPQQILGVLIKKVFRKQIVSNTSISKSTVDNSDKTNIVFVSIQPCFDKKLEASRLDFYHDDIQANEVDLVLSTTESWNLLEHIYQHKLQYFKSENENNDSTNHNKSHSDANISLASTNNLSADKMEIDDTFNDKNDKNTTTPDVNDVISFVRQFPEDLVLSTYNSNLKSKEANSYSKLSEINIEYLFRSFTENGRNLVHSIDNNAGSGGYIEYLAKSMILDGIGENAGININMNSNTTIGENMNIDTDAFIDSNSNSNKMENTFSNISTLSLPYKIGRNSDIADLDIMTSLSLDSNDMSGIDGTHKTQRTIKFGRIYGFRNIQSILMKMKRNKVDLDFIEVMACPSGDNSYSCVNGGGQIKPAAKETLSDTKSRIERVNNIFHSDRLVRPLQESPLIQFIYGNTSQNDLFQQHKNASFSMNDDQQNSNTVYYHHELFHTRYHAIPKLEVIAPLNAKW